MVDLTSLLQQTFVQNAILAAILSSIACGIAGTFVVVRRLTYLGGGIAHSVLGGLGIAVYLGFSPMLGALGFALGAAVLLGWVSMRFRQHEDTVISALWSVGMAIGVVFIYLTPGYSVNLISFLFGNILMVTGTYIAVLVAANALILLTVAVLYQQLVAVAFDREYAFLRGIGADTLYLVLLAMVALTVVILIQTVGVILVIALLTLPAAIARMATRNVGTMMALAVALSMAFTLAGLALSFALNLPSGATIILVTGACYFAALTANRLGTFRRRTAAEQAGAMPAQGDHEPA
jgi:zinc transport system permease protein